MGPVGGRRFGRSVKFADGKNAERRAKWHAWLDPWPTANEELVSNIMVWLSAHDHIYAYHSTSIPAASSVFGTDKTRRKKRVALVWIAPNGVLDRLLCEILDR